MLIGRVILMFPLLGVTLSSAILITLLMLTGIFVCIFRYKIYVEGWAWSVSEKYILACDSPTLYISPHYDTFFARALEPLKHIWPIRETDKCKPLKFAIEWGNNHTLKAQEMGEASSRFVHEDGLRLWLHVTSID